MANVTDTVFYQQWLQLLGWMRDWAQTKGLRFDKESDFTSYIYRMEREYNLPTTVQSASVGMNNGTAVVLASVSPPQEPLKSIHLRVMGGHIEFHLHAGENGLLEGKRAFTQDRLSKILERATAVKA